MNLPNALTVGRIALTPLIALLPLADSPSLRLAALVLFLAAAVTDYVDGMIARSRRQETDLGRLLDPLADKLLLIAMLVPMFWLIGSGATLGLVSRDHAPLVPGVIGPLAHAESGRPIFPFLTPVGAIGLPWWVVAIVVGRELFMTVFRQAAARRGVVIAAIGPAKWKTALQLIWQGAAYCWFWIATLAAQHAWRSEGWRDFAYLNGTVGAVAMTSACALSAYSLSVYVRSYGRVFARSTARE